jgi:hypothetical protein
LVIFLQLIFLIAGFFSGAALPRLLHFASALQSSRMCATHEWRAHLEVCWRMAEKASDESERCSWLDMAAHWKLLIVSHEQVSLEKNPLSTTRGRSSDWASAAEKMSSLCRWLIRETQRLQSEVLLPKFAPRRDAWPLAGLVGALSMPR